MAKRTVTIKDAKLVITIQAALALGHMAAEYVCSSQEEFQRFIDWEQKDLKEHTDECEHDHQADSALHSMVAGALRERDPKNFEPLVHVLMHMAEGAM